MYLLLVFTKSISVLSCSTQLCQPVNEPWCHWQLSGVLSYCLKNVTVTNFCGWFQSVFIHRMMKILQKNFCFLKSGGSSCKTITKRNFAISLPTQPFFECRNFLAILLQSAPPWKKVLYLFLAKSEKIVKTEFFIIFSLIVPRNRIYWLNQQMSGVSFERPANFFWPALQRHQIQKWTIVPFSVFRL